MAEFPRGLSDSTPMRVARSLQYSATRGVYRWKTNTEAHARPGQYSGEYDSRKARTRRLNACSAYVMRVENLASVAYAAVSAHSAWAV